MADLNLMSHDFWIFVCLIILLEALNMVLVCIICNIVVDFIAEFAGTALKNK